MPIQVTVCVGSSCHIKGSRDVIAKFSEIIKENQLENEVALVGCFCMERCGEGTNWKVGDDHISSATVEEAEEQFRSRVIDVVKKA